MRVPTISQDVAKQLLSDPEQLECLDPDRDVEKEGEGDALAADTVNELFERLSTAREDAANERSHAPDGLFEARGAAIVHDQLGLDNRTATSRGFWRWLSLVAAQGHFRSLIEWRFGRDGGHVDEINYGICRQAAIWEGMYARMWLRANLSYDDTRSDPYELTRRGDVDLWRSHIIRQEYARSPILRTALLQYQYPDSNPGTRTLSNDKVRQLARLLRQAHATSQFVAIRREQAEDIVIRNATKT